MPSEQMTVNYNQTGVVSLQFGDKLQVKPDSIGRMAINYRGPERTYPYYSIVDVVQRKLPAGTFKDKIVLVGASATGIGDLRTTPYGGITYPGVEVHANAIDNMLNHGALKRGAAQELWDIGLILFFGIPVGIWMALVAPRWMWFGLSFIIPLLLRPTQLAIPSLTGRKRRKEGIWDANLSRARRRRRSACSATADRRYR